MGVHRQQPITTEEQYTGFNDLRLRGILAAMANRYSAKASAFIYSCYQDEELHSIYRAIRAHGDFQKGGKSKVRRKVIEYPNQLVYDFVNTTMTVRYGPEWMTKPEAIRNELVRPWHVVNNL